MTLLPLCPGQARSGLGHHQLICEFRTTPRRSSFVVRRSSFGESVRVDPTRRVVHPARPSQAVRHPRHATTGTSNVIRALLAHWRPQLGGLTVLVTARNRFAGFYRPPAVTGEQHESVTNEGATEWAAASYRLRTSPASVCPGMAASRRGSFHPALCYVFW